jgi:rfaE bifunctional protein kinase chain/domain
MSADLWLETSLSDITKVKATVFGDFCLDAYWFLDSDEAELSVETGLPLRRVREQRYSLGGAGNVVANLVDLGVGEVRAVGVAGKDVFGAALVDLLRSRGVNMDGFEAADGWQTMAYAKPCRGEKEENRIDFGAFNLAAPELQNRLIANLTAAAKVSDVVILNQQVPGGLSDRKMIERINAVMAQHQKVKIVVDARHYASCYAPAVQKLNAAEAGLFLGESFEGYLPLAKAKDFAHRISAKTRNAVFLTRGEHGIVVADDGKVDVINGLQIVDRIDTVGAGDAVVASLAAALGSGQDAITAAKMANVAAMVTVRKLHTTGTASPEEIREAARDLNYVFESELAESPRQAKKLPGTDIELIGELPSDLAIKHCIFDHDGTLSVLREGWEQIMEPMMMRAILGSHFSTVDEAVYQRVEQMSHEFIDRTTGIQTLVQMQGLVKLVRQAGFVPENMILDEHGYKHLYNKELLRMVKVRMEKLSSGELNSEDFQIKNAGRLLQALHDRGVKLYLASGTDEADVIAEAEAMGYAHLFEGRIFGAVGDVNIEAKKVVLERIIRDNNLSGHEFATFGDGPVEMRETQKRGGICIGIASNEVRRFGWNMAKRKRLIRAGAQILVPDFSQLTALLNVLHLSEVPTHAVSGIGNLRGI